jgi:hypothetical protein
MLHYKFNSAFHVCCGSYNRVECSIEFCGRSGDTSSVSCEGVDPLDEGFAPSEMMFLNQAPWKVGLPLFWLLLPWESGAASFFGARPAMNLYATLLALTISVLACLNCIYHNQETYNIIRQKLNMS